MEQRAPRAVAKELPHDPAMEWHRAGAGATPTGHRVELRVCSPASGTRPDLPRAHPVDQPDHARPPPIRVPDPDPLCRPRVRARLTTLRRRFPGRWTPEFGGRATSVSAYPRVGALHGEGLCRGRGEPGAG